LKNIFKLAAKREMIIQNPINKVEGPGKPKPKPVAMTGDEVRTFLEAAGRRPEGFMFEFAFYLGARPCEYLGLQWSDIDARQGEITIQRSLKWRKGNEWYVTPPKTEKSVRAIELTPYYARRLDEHRRRQLEMKLKAGAHWHDHGFIFTDEDGNPLRIDTTRRLHKKILDDAGLPKTFQLKVSRHSCASALLGSGKVDLKTISERLGHSSIVVTSDIYLVVEKQLQREASEALEEMFGTGKK
jgi:integrase